MSRNRPSHRDRLEAEYLAMAEEFAGVRREWEARLLAKQREIARVEDGGRPDSPVQQAVGPRRDALDSVPESRLAVVPHEVDEAEPVVCGDGLPEDWRRRALRMGGLLIGVCHLVTRPEENQPKLLIQIVKLAADLPGAISMRELASIYGYSPERISQRVEDIQRRFNLPKNQHNKSAAAVAAYRVNAGLINQPKQAA